MSRIDVQDSTADAAVRELSSLSKCERGADANARKLAKLWLSNRLYISPVIGVVCRFKLVVPLFH